LTGGPKVQIAGFCFPEIRFVQIAVRKDDIAYERKKGPAAPVSDAGRIVSRVTILELFCLI
jgi:hypothetical protein